VPETVPVERRGIVRTVEATGTLKPALDAALSFGTSGRVEAVLVEEGDTVVAGDTLAVLAAEGEAVRAGRAAQSVLLAQAELDAAVRAAADARATTEATVAQAVRALERARVVGENDAASHARAREQAKDDMILTLSGALVTVRNALSDADAILGVENSLTNDTFEAYLSANNSEFLSLATLYMRSALERRARTEDAVLTLDRASDTASVKQVAGDLRAELALLERTLLFTRRVLDATTSNASTYSMEDVAADRTTIDTTRAAVHAKDEAIVAALAAWDNAVASEAETRALTTVALALAQEDEAHARAAAAASVAAADASIATRRAVLAQAQADQALADLDASAAVIVAPTAGTITRVLVDVGERIAPGVEALTLVGGQDTWQGELQVPESDLALVRVGQQADVRFDTYGDGVVFTAHVMRIDPASAAVEGVVYNRVLLAIDPIADVALRTGLSLDASLVVAERSAVLTVPQRAVFGTASERRVRVLLPDGLTSEERIITVGLRGDGGILEVLSGLTEGDRVLTSRTP
jgi:RND family efflux transporter MFP subunit